ncbi:MAG: hypothetical protein FWC60_00300 [Firmicutes bacterium]|nr:hypothetical protein [Bacillota bacterium]
MKILKPLIASAIYAGTAGAVSQVILILYSVILGRDFPGLLPLTVLTLGVLMMCLYIGGLIQPLIPLCGFGAILPLPSLVAAVADGILEVQKSGAPFKKAYKLSSAPVKKMLTIAFCASLVFSVVVWAFKQTPDFAVTAIDPSSVTPVMGIVWSFIIAAGVGFVGQIIMMILRPTMQGVLNILLCTYCFSAILAVFGISQYLNALGTGGYSFQVLCAGETVFTSIYIGMIQGQWPVAIMRLVLFCAVIASMFGWGMIAARIRGKKSLPSGQNAPVFQQEKQAGKEQG